MREVRDDVVYVILAGFFSPRAFLFERNDGFDAFPN